MNRILFYILMGFLVMSCSDDNSISGIQADAFMKFYGETNVDKGNGVKQLKDGGYVVVGTLEKSLSTHEMIVLRTDKYGNISWSDTVKFENASTFGRELVVTDDDKLVVLGNAVFSNTDSDVFVASYQANDGKELGITRLDNNLFNYDVGNTIELCSGGFIVAGYTASDITDLSTKDVMLVKLDANLGFLWRKIKLANNAEEEFNAVVEKPDGHFIVVGNTNFSGHLEKGQEETCVLIVETTADGNELLKKAWGTTKNDYGIDIKMYEPDKFLVLGHTSVNATDDIFLFKITKNILERENYTVFRSSNVQKAGGLSVHNDNFVIAGTDGVQASSNDIFLWNGKINDYSENYRRNFGLPDYDDLGPSIMFTDDGGTILTGSVKYEDNAMIALIKLNENGDL